MTTTLDAIRQRITDTEQWLSEQPIKVRQEQRHLEEGTQERAYWHYGYAMALKDVLRALDHSGETKQ